MVTESIINVEHALRWIGIAERSGDPQAYSDAAARCTSAIGSVLADSDLWRRLGSDESTSPGVEREPRKAPASASAANKPIAEESVDWDALESLLGDKL